MSQFYDNASLVVVPSGYKAGTVYAQKPLTTDGQLTFTRTGDTATRVNSAGLIEKVRTNINTYSEQLDNAAWTKQSTTVTANATTAPNNTLTADKLIATATTAFHGIFNVNATLSSLHTFSFYAKKAEYNFVTALDQFSGRFLASFNLDTGVVSSGSGASIQSVGNGWYRCAISFDGAASAVVATLAPSPSSASVNYLGDGTSGIFVWGVQLETGDIATAYIPTTTAAVSTGPVANVPRLDYLGSTCPRLILEGQRTNLVTYSEQLDNAAWTKTNCTISANAVTSPDGYQNADNIVTTAANSDIGRLTATITANTATYTQSAFFKWVSGYELVKYRIALSGGTAQGAYLTFNARTGAFSASDSTYKIESYGNGWYRISLQITNNGTNTSLITQIYPTNETTQTQTLSAWGFDVQAGAYPTSYIPCLAASATRGADACSKTGISSLIGQTEGTLFVEVNFNGSGFGTDNDFLVYSGNGSNTNSMYIDYYNNLFRFVVFTGGSLTFYTDIATTNGTHKLALAYKSGSYAAYLDGVQIAVDTNAANPPTTSIFSLGGGATGFTAITKNTNQALLFKTRLTNAELAELTTL